VATFPPPQVIVLVPSDQIDDPPDPPAVLAPPAEPAAPTVTVEVEIEVTSKNPSE
jgi:hypothetical protein